MTKYMVTGKKRLVKDGTSSSLRSIFIPAPFRVSRFIELLIDAGESY